MANATGFGRQMVVSNLEEYEQRAVSFARSVEYVNELDPSGAVVPRGRGELIKLRRNIGHLQYAAAITVDTEGGTHYTSDWAAFLAAEEKVRDEFEGNVIDLGVF